MPNPKSRGRIHISDGNVNDGCEIIGENNEYFTMTCILRDEV